MTHPTMLPSHFFRRKSFMSCVINEIRSVSLRTIPEYSKMENQFVREEAKARLYCVEHDGKGNTSVIEMGTDERSRLAFMYTTPVLFCHDYLG